MTNFQDAQFGYAHNHTVSVDTDAGGTAATIPDQTLPHGSQITRPTNPAREDYFFDYWYRADGDANTPFDFAGYTSLDEDFTLVAHWTSNEVSYTPKNADQTITLNQPVSPGAGYVFAGWKLIEAPEGVTLDGNKLLIPAGAEGKIRIEPIWELKYIVNRDDHVGYVQGYTDGTFKPEKTLTRAEIATVLYRLTTDATKTAPLAKSFTDVPNGKWYTQEVNYIASIGVATGYSDGTFKPEQNITRAELTVLVSRWLAVQRGGATGSPFSDLAQNHWAYAEILAFVGNGWVKGYENGTFKPDQSVTRAEFVTILNRVLGRKLATQDAQGYRNLYSDLTGGTHWAFADIIEASVTHEHTFRSNGYENWD
jgi:uncharacterized repeat protein (TIGR02543 family)